MKNSCSSLVIVFTTVCLLLAAATYAAFAQDQSVNPGINDSFQNPDPKAFVERFEREGREVYDNRQAIVDKLGIEPGMVDLASKLRSSI